jgi:hypothetical protein
MHKSRFCDFYQRSPVTGPQADTDNLADILIYFTFNWLMPNRLIEESPASAWQQQGHKTGSTTNAADIETSRKALLEYLENPEEQSIPKSCFFIFAEWSDLADTAREVYERIKMLQSRSLTVVAFRQRYIDLYSEPATLLAILELEMKERLEIKAELNKRGVKLIGEECVFPQWFANSNPSGVYGGKDFMKHNAAVAKKFEVLTQREKPTPYTHTAEGKKLTSQLTIDADLARQNRRGQGCDFCTIYMGDYAITVKDNFSFLFQAIADFIVKKDMILANVYCDYDLTSESRHRNLPECIVQLDNKKGKSAEELRNHKSFFLFPTWQSIAKNENEAYVLIQVLRKKNIIPVAVMQEQGTVNIHATRKSILSILKPCYATNPEKDRLWEKVIGHVPPDALDFFPLPKRNLLTEKIKLIMYRSPGKMI